MAREPNLPQALEQLLFPSEKGGTLCGMRLGERVADLALPAWWNETLQEHERSGRLAIGERGIVDVDCKLTETFGKVSGLSVRLQFEPAWDTPCPNERAVFDDLGALLTERLGKRREKMPKKLLWDTPGAVAGDLSLGKDGGARPSVWIDLVLARGAAIEAEGALFIDGDALATIVASKAFPRARCHEVFARYFARASDLEADAADRKGMAEIYAAAGRERPDAVRPMVEQLLALLDWAEINRVALGVDDSLVGPRRILHVLHHVARCRAESGQWLRVEAGDLVQLVGFLDVPVAERARWAYDVVRALEWGDEDAMRQVSERVAMLPPPERGGPHTRISYDCDDEVAARTFALVTAALPDDEARVRFAISGQSFFGANPSRAATAFLVSRGCPAPVLPPAATERSIEEQVRSKFLLAVRASHPAMADEVVAAVLKEIEGRARTMRTVCNALADEAEEGEKSRWRIGAVVVRHSGKATAGRWHIELTDDLEAAGAVYAGQKPPKKPRASK